MKHCVTAGDHVSTHQGSLRRHYPEWRIIVRYGADKVATGEETAKIHMEVMNCMETGPEVQLGMVFFSTMSTRRHASGMVGHSLLGSCVRTSEAVLSGIQVHPEHY
jgi:hypothetical protein